MKPIITVDGLDGSGKSTFAARLADALGAVVLRVDDFRRAVTWGADEASTYYEAYYDLDDCERCLSAFAAGAAGVEVPVFDSARDCRAGARTISFADAPVAILEGVFPLRMPSAAGSFVIYLETSPSEARRRILARDQAKGRTPTEIDRRIAQRYFPAQSRYRAAHDPRARASVIIDNESPAAPRALKRDLSSAPDTVRAALDRALPRGLT